VKFLPAGPSALLVELDGIEAVFALLEEIDRRRREGWTERFVEVIPGARTLLLDGIGDPDRLAGEMSTWSIAPDLATDAGEVVITCHYGGPDLTDVARHWGVSEDELVEIHTSLAHRVAFCGFAPGFAYIEGLGERWSVPRRPDPRPAVPAGSVALASIYTGIYPRSSPGGWQLIGRTNDVVWDERAFDEAGTSPALLRPGMTVRFDAT